MCSILSVTELRWICLWKHPLGYSLCEIGSIGNFFLDGGRRHFFCIRMRKTFRKTTICHISAFNFSFIEVQDSTLLNLMSLSTVRQLERSRFLHGHIFSISSSFSFIQGSRTTSSVSKLAQEGVMGMLGKEKTYWCWNERVNNDTHDSQS